MVDMVLGTIFTIIYPMVSILFVIIDLIQNLFYSFAGIGTIYVGNDQITSGNTGEDTDTGIVFYLLRSSTVQNLFYALLILAIVLLVLFTIIAFIKNIYSEKPKSWKSILGSTLKGLVFFFVTPIICLFGVWAGNILLQAIYSATTQDAESGWAMSRQVFVAAAYQANRFRTGEFDEGHFNALNEYYDGSLGTFDASQTDYYAELVDDLYLNTSNYGVGGVNIYEQMGVNTFYNITEINYILLIVASIFMMYALGAITFGAVKRLFYLTFLFVLSPILNAMYPIDDGSAAKGAMKDFYKQVIGVYSAVVGLNLFFAIFPMLQDIDLTGTIWVWSGSLGIVNIILIICGLMVVKELISLVNGYIGGNDLYSTGAGVMGGVKGNIGKVVKGSTVVAGSFARVHGARKRAGELGTSKTVAGAKSFFGDIGKGLSSLGGKVTGVDPYAIYGDVKKQSSEGSKAYDERLEKGTIGEQRAKRKQTKQDLKQLRGDVVQSDGSRFKKLRRFNPATAGFTYDTFEDARGTVFDESGKLDESRGRMGVNKHALDTMKRIDKVKDEGIKKNLQEELKKNERFKALAKSRGIDDSSKASWDDIQNAFKTENSLISSQTMLNQAQRRYQQASANAGTQQDYDSFMTGVKLRGIEASVVGTDGKIRADLNADSLNLNKDLYAKALKFQDGNPELESARQALRETAEKAQRTIRSNEVTIEGNDALNGLTQPLLEKIGTTLERISSKDDKKSDKNTDFMDAVKKALEEQQRTLSDMSEGIKDINTNLEKNNKNKK